MILQAGRDLDLLHLAVQRVLHGIEQCLVLGGGILGGFLLLLGFQTQITAVHVLELHGAVLALGILAGVAVQDLQAELVHVLGQQQHVKALVQHQLCGGQFCQTVGGVACGKVDVLLLCGHLVDVLLQGDHLLLLGRPEQQQVAQQFGVHSVVRISTKLDLTAELLPELLVLRTVVVQHGVQLVLDLLFQCVMDQLQLAVLLQHLTADIQAQILTVHNAFYKAEVIRQQVGTLFHNEHTGSVQRQTLLVVLGVEVVGAVAGHEQQGIVVGGTLGAAHDDPGGVSVITELILVEAVVLLIGHFALLLLPDGDHAVQGLQLGVGLPLGLVVLGLGVWFRLLTALFALHLDGVAHIVAVLLHDGHNAVFVQEVVVFLSVGIRLDVQNDLGANGVLLGGGHLVAVHTGGLPLPCLVRAISLGDNGQLIGHHKGRVEAHTELTDDINVLVLVVLFEIQRTGVGNGTQILLQLFLGHTDTVILHGQDAVFLIAGDEDAEIALVHAHGGIGQALIVQLINGVRSIGDQLPQEDLFIGIDGVDHHVHQFFALCLKFFLGHNTKPLLSHIWCAVLGKLPKHLALITSEC